MNNIERVIKFTIIEGILNSMTMASVAGDKLFALLLNDEKVSKLKAINYYKNINSLTEKSGIFKVWLESVAEGSPTESAACMRVARTLDRVENNYNMILPSCLKGTNAFCTMLRLFFIDESTVKEQHPDLLPTFTLISTLLNTIFFLEMIFEQDIVLGVHSETWLYRILLPCGYLVTGTITEIAQGISQGITDFSTINEVFGADLSINIDDICGEDCAVVNGNNSSDDCADDSAEIGEQT